jgi:hypothetical protein
MAKPEKLGTVIATRELVLDGNKAVIVRIGKPHRPRGDEFYACPYHISGPGLNRLSYAAGVDSVDALQWAFQKIGIELRATIDASASKKLRWEGGSDGDVGFPLRAEIEKYFREEDEQSAAVVPAASDTSGAPAKAGPRTARSGSRRARTARQRPSGQRR